MSIQSSSFNAFTTQRTIPNPTIDSGITAGAVFDGRGHDFLSPVTVLGDVHDFSNTVTPVTSNNLINQLITPNPIAKNSNSSSVLRSTNGTIGNIMSANFGNGLSANIQFIPGTNVPNLGTNPGATEIVANTTFFANSIGTPAFIAPSAAYLTDLANYNPTAWTNPTSTNVLVGTMDAQNYIYGGGGIIPSPYANRFPLYPYIAINQTPFQNYNFPGSFVPAQQAQFFPTTTLSGSPFYNAYVPVTNTQPDIKVQLSLAILKVNTQIGQLQKDIANLQAERQKVLTLDATGKEDANFVRTTSQNLQNQINVKQAELAHAQETLALLKQQQSQLGGQPAPVANSQSINPFPAQVSLMENVLSQPTMINGQSVTVNQLADPNGVPAWVA